MSLPDVIEIVPLAKPLPAAVTVPGSKSVTNRALVLAALAKGATTLRGALWSEDTQVMVACLEALGFAVEVTPDPEEPGNRSIRVAGQGGVIPRGGTTREPLELFVGNAGTAARFLTALTCLGHGVYRLHGVTRMHMRPQAALFQALRQLGYRIDSENNKLPAVIHGTGSRPGACQVSVEESSQFASALILAGETGQWRVDITGANLDELPYVEMTRRLATVFPKNGGDFQIEPDASGGSYFWGAGWLLPGGVVSVNAWPVSGWQIDADFPNFLPPRGIISRERDLGDSIMTGIVLAPFGEAPVRFTDLGRLRVQECERVAALRTELSRCGARVIETGDTLEVFPSALHGAEVETYCDHRMAMCFAMLGLRVPGIKIVDPACVKKTFPNFFQKLAAAPPRGLGATILDANGYPLSEADLFAE